MSSPTLTFTPVMFHASQKGIKDTTRRLIPADCFRSTDGQIKFLGDSNTVKHASHSPGQIKPMVTGWRVNGSFGNCKPSDLNADSVFEAGNIYWEPIGTLHSLNARPTNREFYSTPTHQIDPARYSHESKLYPARFFPKFLYHLAPQVEILTVTAEFLHDITEASALRDGIQSIGDKFGVPDLRGNFTCQASTAREAYFKLWDTINAAKDGGKYAAKNNPACWVITYRVLAPGSEQPPSTTVNAA